MKNSKNSEVENIFLKYNLLTPLKPLPLPLPIIVVHIIKRYFFSYCLEITLKV